MFASHGGWGVGVVPGGSNRPDTTPLPAPSSSTRLQFHPSGVPSPGCHVGKAHRGIEDQNDPRCGLTAHVSLVVRVRIRHPVTSHVSAPVSSPPSALRSRMGPGSMEVGRTEGALPRGLGPDGVARGTRSPATAVSWSPTTTVCGSPRGRCL